jgi:hypothetical protein
MHKPILAMCLFLFAAAVLVPPAHASLPGAIFTTVDNGSEVNYNIYQHKEDVYLNGGPGPGAPEGAAGLPEGDYVFMVTDPSGKKLLSTDIAACRIFTVKGGDISGLVTGGCGAPHLTNDDIDHDSKTVQLMPYLDTPNRGNEYKVWATPVGSYVCDLTAVDCNSGTHGFINADSKTDNYKVKGSVLELDPQFVSSSTGNFIDGLEITWIDTLGASNNKWSYYNRALDVNHEAHIEAVEFGTHTIVVSNQPGCTVGAVYLNGSLLPTSGPQSVSVKVSPGFKGDTYRVTIICQQ